MIDLLILYDVEMPPFPIKMDPDGSSGSDRSLDSDDTVVIYGLPDGIIYDPETNVISGIPKSIGRHAVLVVVTDNQQSFELTGMTINVIECSPIVPNLKPIGHHHMQLGDPMPLIPIEVDDPSAEIVVDGLPLGVEYDPFTNQINGYPETTGEYKVTIRAINRYGHQSIIRSMIYVEGIINPALELIMTVDQVVADQRYQFHQVNDHIIYTMTVTNTGNVPLTNIQLKDAKLGSISSKIRLIPHQTITFKHQYIINARDLDRGVINVNLVASGEIGAETKVMTLSVPHTVQIRGHDHLSLYMKLIQTETNLFLICNCNQQPITQLSMFDQYGSEIKLNKDQLGPNELLFGTYRSRDHNRLTLIGRLPNDQITGNQLSIGPKDENNIISLQLYIAHKHPTLIARLKTNNHQSLTGIVKFYDGLQCLGKSSIHNNISLLDLSCLPDNHHLYAIYQGDHNRLENGSNIVTLTEQLRKNEQMAEYLIRQHTYLK